MDGGKYGSSKGAGFFPGRSRGLAGGPNRFHVPFRDIPDDMNGSRIPQGEVTTNRTFIRDLAKRRRASSSKADANHRIEMLSDDSQLHINEGDLLIFPVRARNFRGGIAQYADRETQGAVMSSMRAMRVGEIDIKNPSLWKASFAFGGFAKTNKQIGGVTEGSRVAASMAGGRSVRTNSSEVFLPGNIVRLELPSPIPEERQKVADKARALGIQVDVAKPYLRPERADDIRVVVQDYFESYLNNYVIGAGKKSERDALLLTDPFSTHDNSNELTHMLQFFITEYGRGSAIDFANYLALGEKLGLCTIDIPSRDTVAMNRLSRSLAQLSTRKVDSEPGRTIVGLKDTGELRFSDDQGTVTGRRNQRTDNVVALYQLLGLLPRDNFDPSPELIEVVMLNRLHGLMPATSAAEELRQATAITHTGPRRHISLLNPIEARIENLHANRSRLGLLSFYQLYYEMTSKRVGTCLNAGDGSNGTNGNQEIDLVF